MKDKGWDAVGRESHSLFVYPADRAAWAKNKFAVTRLFQELLNRTGV